MRPLLIHSCVEGFPAAEDVCSLFTASNCFLSFLPSFLKALMTSCSISKQYKKSLYSKLFGEVFYFYKLSLLSGFLYFTDKLWSELRLKLAFLIAIEYYAQSLAFILKAILFLHYVNYPTFPFGKIYYAFHHVITRYAKLFYITLYDLEYLTSSAEALS